MGTSFLHPNPQNPSLSSSISILRLDDVMTRTGLSRSFIYAMIANGDFPAPIKLGPRASGWLAHEIDAWIESRISLSRPNGKEGL